MWAWHLQTDGTVQGRKPLEVRKLRCAKAGYSVLGMQGEHVES